jgi:hypothetical protein
MESYRNIVSTLGYPEDQIHGVSLSLIESCEMQMSLPLPLELRTYYEEVGAMALNHAHNRLYAPNELQCIDDYVVFLEENQCVVVWGFRHGTSEQNPAIFQGHPGSPHYTWYPEKWACREFLTQTLYLHTLFGGFVHSAQLTDRAVLSAIVHEWTSAPYNDDELRLYYRDGIIVGELGPQKSSEIYVSTHKSETLETFEREYHVILPRL